MAWSPSSRRCGARHSNRSWHAGRSPCASGGSDERVDHHRHHARAEGAAPRDRIVSHRERSLRSEEHTSELQSRGHLVCRLLLEKKKKKKNSNGISQKNNN